MVLDRSMDEAARAKKAAPTTTSMVVSQRLRSQAAGSASQRKTVSNNTPAKEKWVTKPTVHAKEFEATLGKPDFKRVTGTYTPGEPSPSWDPSWDAAAPFHRSTPSHELEDEVICDDDVMGVHAITRAPVRMDISLGLGVTVSGSTASTVTSNTTRVTSSQALGALPKVMVHGTQAAASTISTTAVSTCLNATNIINRTACATSSLDDHNRMPTNPMTTSNPFDNLAAGGQGGGGTGLSQAGRHLLNTTGARGVISPIPHPPAAASSFSSVSGRQEQRQDAAQAAAVIAKGQHLVEVINTEYGQIDVDSYTAELLQELCLEANSHKKSLARVEEKLLGAPDAERQRRLFAETRAQLVAFIRSAQRRICESQAARPNTWRAALPARSAPEVTVVDQPPASQHRLSTLSVQLKRDRVVAQEHRVTEEMAAVVAESQALQKSAPEGDVQVQVALERGKDLKERGAELAREALALYTDAVDAELGQSAKALYDCMQLMQATIRDTMATLSELKATTRVGLSARVKDPDFPPPLFSGAADEDVYRFLDLFDQYVDARGLSDRASVRAMLTVCLKGQLSTSCSDMDNIQAIRAYLLKIYGQPRVLLDAKLKEFAKLGKCPAFPAEKRRDWFIRTQNQLNYLLKICKKFSLMDDLMFSPILRQVQDNFTPKVQQEYLEVVAEVPDLERNRKRFFTEILNLVSRQLAQATADVNTNHILGIREPERQVVKKAAAQVNLVQDDEVVRVDSEDDLEQVAPSPTVVKPRRRRRKPAETVSQVDITVAYSEPQVMKCVACPGKHTYIFYCPEFQRAPIDDRIQIAKAQGACRRCLRMDSKLDLANRAAWFAKHEVDCKTEWQCKYEWTCGKAGVSQQIHMLLCKRHARFNKEREQDFVKSLDQASIGPNTRFFFASFSLGVPSQEDEPRVVAEGERKVVRATSDRAIYMLQTVFNDSGLDLLMFYDSGCSVAALSERAADALHSRNLVPGPTNLNVAGGQVLENSGGVDEFELDLFDTETKVQMRGLVMDTVTNPFALYNLQEAYEELCRAYGSGEGVALPEVPDTIGGSKVDVMVGIKYLAFFPELVFTLPSGLAIYESQIRTVCGRRGVIGGPHKSWAHAEERIEFMSSFAFLSAEIRAYRAQANVLDDVLFLSDPCPSVKPWEDEAASCGCPCHAADSSFSLQEETKRFSDAEKVGADITYRCIKCRSCSDCKRGELLEETSLQEEAEQALIEQSVWLEPESRRLMCRLPFVKDPVTNLEDNRAQAERIFASQLKAFSRNDKMKEAVLAAHDKLLTRGHVAALDSLTEEEKKAVSQTMGSYVLPWSCVAKQDSVSTPFRVVFNASFRTRTGESLNSVLAKGANKLPLILSLLLRFRSRRFALAADVSMAYNAVKLVPEHFNYQKYLWKEELDPDSPTITMVIKTLIYGVRPSGNLTGAGFVRVADYAQEHFPHLAKGASVIRDDTYVDDSVAAFDTLEECHTVASAMVEVLGLGGAVIKDFAFSDTPPSEKLSADGIHVGVLGYLWATIDEKLFLAVRPTVLGRGRAAKKCSDEPQDLWQALSGTFTKRTLQGQLARIYDPLGLATPITANLKLDLAEVVALKTDWDEKLPDRLLQKWVDNLERIQRLRKVPFPRTIMPEDPLNTKLELIVSVDASKDVAVAAVYARTPLRNGEFSCRLLIAKSKLVHTSTVPRGELKAAVMGASLAHAVVADLGDQVEDVIFVSDSTIVLYWMAHDSRPLQTAVRNAVIEIRRLSDVTQWFHVASEDNVADLGTRPADVSDVEMDSDWINGRQWMSGPRDKFPIRDINQVSLDAEEARLAAKEIKVGEVSAHATQEALDRVKLRYEYSRYVVDPCNASWPKAVNVLAMVLRFVSKLQTAVQRRKEGRSMVTLPVHLQVIHVTSEERQAAEAYFFRKATNEVKKFMKKADYESCTIEKDDILYYKSRILDGQIVEDHDGILADVKPLHFVRPVADRYSPVSYSIMRHVHDEVANHMNTAVMIRESREISFIFKGRELAIEISSLCNHCKKLKAEKVENEMGRQHPSTMRVGPAFSTVQIDMAGPWYAECEHTCRSTVKVWALVFKDPATCAVAAYAMPASNSAAFVQAYNRHAFRHGHPVKVHVDAASSLLKACEQAEMSWLEISHLISAHYGVGFDYEVCPPHAHYYHGAVERSIKEIKRIFNAMFKGLKLHLLAYETAFSFCCNALNNLPVSLGTKVDHLGHKDIITPNRLLLGRNNKRSPHSLTQVPSNSRLAEQLEEVEKSWWKLWADEKLVDFVPQPAKWPRTNNNIAVGLIVIFPMKKPKSAIGEIMWKYGKVAEVLPSSDGLVRRVKITYQNYKEEVWRYVVRSAREIAVIHSEEDLEFFRLMREFAAEHEKEPFEPTQAWQGVPHEEDADEADYIGNFACVCLGLE